MRKREITKVTIPAQNPPTAKPINIRGNANKLAEKIKIFSFVIIKFF